MTLNLKTDVYQLSLELITMLKSHDILKKYKDENFGDFLISVIGQFVKISLLPLKDDIPGIAFEEFITYFFDNLKDHILNNPKETEMTND